MNRNLFSSSDLYSFPTPFPDPLCPPAFIWEERTAQCSEKEEGKHRTVIKKKVIHYHQTKKADTKQGQPNVQFRNRPAQFSAPKRLLTPIGEIPGSRKSPI